MTRDEVAALLAVAAVYDNRRPDPAVVTGWLAILGPYRFEECRDAVVAHYADSTDYLMPAHITRRVKAARAERPDSGLVLDVAPPAENARPRPRWFAERALEAAREAQGRYRMPGRELRRGRGEPASFGEAIAGFARHDPTLGGQQPVEPPQAAAS